MKTRSITVLSLLILFITTAYAGNPVKPAVDVRWGDEFRMPKKHFELGFLGSPREGFVLLSQQYRKSMAIQTFDSALKMINEKSISLETMPKGYGSEYLGEVGKKNFWFYSTATKDDDKERLFAQEIDIKKGDFKGAAKEVATCNDELTYSRWSFVKSADSTKLMVHYQLKPVVKNDSKSHAVLGFVVMDDKLGKMWNKEVEMPYTEKVMITQDYQVDRNGNAYVLAKIYEEGRKESKDDHPNYHYEIMRFSRTADKPAIAKFDLGDKYVVDIALTEDLNGRMVIAGYYAKNKNSATEGAFLYTFDEATMTAKSIQKGMYEFPIEIMKMYESEKAVKKMEKADKKGKDVAVNELKFRSLRTAEDGSITMFGEQSYVVTYTYSDGKNTYTRTTYYYLDIYGMKIAADGTMKWVCKVPKSQVGNSPYTFGYFLRSDGADNYLFFVDNAKNIDLPKDEAPATHAGGAGGVLMCVKVAEDGTVSKNMVYDFRAEETYMVVSNMHSVSPNQIIGRGMDHKISVPLLITVQ